MPKASLLLIDDDRHVLESMGDWLRSQGYAVECASTYAEAERRLKKQAYDLALVDIRLGDGDGFDLLAYCKKHAPNTAVVLLTGYGTVETAVEAIRAGAFDFLTKPLIDDELELALQRAINQRKVVEENRQLKAQLDKRLGLENILAHDPRMQRVFDIVDSVADTRATVLITGESGTGKSMIARAIHRRSSRREGPFVEVACGALPETLLESELFGHVAGAFTGALGHRVGKFKQADGGTIFLDEIATASPGMQVKLLRVLQEFEFEPVGGTETYHVETRVILATNEELSKRVAAGTFRQDLYYRVNVINIELPPLRDRSSDVPLLASHFLNRCCQETGRQITGFTDEAMAAMQQYLWPGNVRELQNVVERAVFLGKNPIVTLNDLPDGIRCGTPGAGFNLPANGNLKGALSTPERQIILDALRRHQWNRNMTAEALGINRTTLYKKMKRLGLEEPVPGV